MKVIAKLHLAEQTTTGHTNKGADLIYSENHLQGRLTDLKAMPHMRVTLEKDGVFTIIQEATKTIDRMTY